MTPGYDASVRDRVLRIFQAGQQLTDEELIRKYEAVFGYAPHSTIRTRRKELVKQGKVRETGELGVVVSTGRRCNIFQVVAA